MMVLSTLLSTLLVHPQSPPLVLHTQARSLSTLLLNFFTGFYPMERHKEIRSSILQANSSLLSTISTSLGPKGLDKMIIKGKKTTVTNDGATILSHFSNSHPVYKILSEVSKTQDEECGDGTTSVVVLTCSLLNNMPDVHPNTLCDALIQVRDLALEYIERIKRPVYPNDMLNAVLTSMGSKIASTSMEIAESALRAMKIVEGDRKKIRIVKKVGGVLDDTKAYSSILLPHKGEVCPGSYKVAVIQFCLSAPKTNMDSKIIVKDPEMMEKVIKEERKYILDMCKKIKKSGCQIVIIQKSILRDSLSDLAKHFLRQLNIIAVDGVERGDVEYISEALGVSLVSDIDFLEKDETRNEYIREVEVGKVSTSAGVSTGTGVSTGINTGDFLELKNYGCTILVRGCDEYVVEEGERCINDALCVIKCLEEEPFLVPGGGAVEMGIAVAISSNNTITREIARAFECVPYFLSKNAGLYSVEILSKLRKIIKEKPTYGISMRSGDVGDMMEDDCIVQPSKISKSVVNLAVETVSMILKIDDILPSRK